MGQPPPPPPTQPNTPLPATSQPDPPGTVGSLVWAIIGFNLLPVIGSIVAVVMGYKARRRAQLAGQADPSVARAGRILGWVGIIVAVVSLALVVLVVALGLAGLEGSLEGPDGFEIEEVDAGF